MKLIVGLGNPGRQYVASRHNAGFWVVDAVATKYGAQFSYINKLFAQVTKTNIGAQDVVLAKPDTYMNLSGKAVQAILHWYKIESDEALIVHDDVALPLGKLRFQKAGGAGGQHGVEDIMQQLGGNGNFDRLKFGVGPDPGGERRADYVLSPIADADQKLCQKALQLATESINLWVTDGVQKTMNQYNGIDLRTPSQPLAEDKDEK